MAVTHRGLNPSIYGAVLCGRTGRGDSLTAQYTYKTSEVTCKRCLKEVEKIRERNAKRRAAQS